MKFVDEILGIEPGVNIDSQHYERYGIGLKWATVGGLAIIAGMTGDAAHIKVGADIVAAGVPVFWMGGATVVLQTPGINETRDS